MSTTTTPKPTQPAEQIRLGAIRAAIWRNHDDQDRARYAVTFERIYRDSDHKWHSTTSFGRDELLTVAKVADLANSKVHALQAADRAKEAVESNGTAAAVEAATATKAKAR